MKIVKESGVRGVISVSHRERGTGRMHGHSYTVKAFFPFAEDAENHKAKLAKVLEPLDHSVLPDEIAWAEDLAEHILLQLADSDCCRVECNRDAEGFYGSAEILRG